MINCLEYALNFWNENKRYKIFYNSDHCVNLPKDCIVDGFSPIEDWGFKYFEQWYFNKLITKSAYNLLIAYFNEYCPKERAVPIDDGYLKLKFGKAEVLDIYSDGSCAVHSTKKGRWAYVALENDVIQYEDANTVEDTTNGEMELYGLYQALECVKKHYDKYSHFRIYCDSSYIVNGYNEWCDGWRDRGWKKANKAPVKYTEVWKEIDKIRASNIEVIWVKGHSDNQWNNYVDDMTREY